MSGSSAPSASARRVGQSLTPGNLIALYIIDLNSLGVSQQFAFTSNVDRQRGIVRFRGIDFAPTEIRCSGFELSTQGALPQPTIEISNVTRAMSSAAVLFNDLIGARLTRIRTYTQFLDNGETPDPVSGAYPADIYSFEQKTSHTKEKIVWTLAAAMDQEGRLLPGRTIIRDVCPWRYRRWDKLNGEFDYSAAQCPYTGDKSYDRDGAETTPDKDEPGRHIEDCCKVRFGATGQLPFGGFPGVSRVRA